MLHLISAFTARVSYFLRRHAPTNLLLNAIRSRRGLKWGVPAMLLAVPYVYIARLLVSLIAHGAPGWLNLLVLVAAWNGLKFAVVGPVSVILLLRVRAAEWRARRAARGLTPSAA